MSIELSPRVKVRSTVPKLPLPLNHERPPILTERLVILPFSQEDLHELHTLRIQPEVMKFTAVGRIDRDLIETQASLDRFLAPNDTKVFNFIIRLRSTQEMVGIGGVMRFPSEWFGWPEVGYMMKTEYWGQGYATEFLRGFTKRWWELPREATEMEVDELSVLRRPGGTDHSDEAVEVPEQLTAMVETNNRGSMRVMEKCGFRIFKQWTQEDNRAGFEGIMTSLTAFALSDQAREAEST